MNVSASSIAARPRAAAMVSRCSGVVHAGEIVVGRRARLDDLAARGPRPRSHHLHGLGALDPFGMSRRRQVVGESIAKSQ